MTATTAWSSRPSREALSSEKLAGLVESEIERSDRMLFTLTPRAELDEIGRWQQLLDQAWVGQMRSIVAADNRAGRARAEFASDEVALAINASPTAGSRLHALALSLAALPGLLEAVSAGILTQRHAVAVVAELDKVDLSLEQRCSIVLIALARYRSQTPGELRTMVAKLILLVDLEAAQARQDKATADRGVSLYRDVDGQAVIHARGPLAQAAAVEAALDAWLREHPKAADDDRTEHQRRYDLFISLLTGGAQAGSWQAAILVPFSTALGGELELADIPGLGPILPSTAHELLEQTDTALQVAIDPRGQVIAVSDPLPMPTRDSVQAGRNQTREASRGATARDDEGEDPQGEDPQGEDPQGEDPQPDPGPGPDNPPTPPLPGGSALGLDRSLPAPREPRDDEWARAMRLLMSQPPPDRLVAQNLTSRAYTTPTRIRRYLQFRDRHCVFPGCHMRITDVDHRIPWPLGPTSPHNLQLLCRRHHRAKQAVLTVQLTPDGHYRWTTRGGWQFERQRQGY